MPSRTGRQGGAASPHCIPARPIERRRRFRRRRAPFGGRGLPGARGRLALALLCAACQEPGTRPNHAIISLEPLSVDFGVQTAGAERTEALRMANLGTRVLLLYGAEIRDDARRAFAVHGVPSSVAVGSEAFATVTYRAPDEEGPDGARLVFSSNADNAPETQVSVAGRSERPCGPGLRFCDEGCFDPLTSAVHCGGCGVACAESETCVEGRCLCVPRSCADAGAECGEASDGCGGALHCPPCAGAEECRENRCLLPECSDGRENGSESDTDCGGTCAPCGLDRRCRTGDDCAAGLVCTAGRCSPCTQSAECPQGLVCFPPGTCGPCRVDEDCESDQACRGGRCLTCPDEAAYNECGRCGGPGLPLFGTACTTPAGCAGAWSCSPDATDLVCSDSAGGCWSPSLLASLYLWYSAADSVVEADAGLVTAISDLSGNGRTATSSSAVGPFLRPPSARGPELAVAAGGFFASKALHFVRSTGHYFLAYDLPDSPDFRRGTSFTAVAVGSSSHDQYPTDDATWSMGLDGYASGGEYCAVGTILRTGSVEAGASAYASARVTGVPAGIQVHVGRFDAAARRVEVRVDGGSATRAVSASRPFDIAVRTMRLGHMNTAHNVPGYAAFDLWLGDFLLFTDALDEAALAKVEGYLAWRHGVQSRLPSAHPYRDRRP